MSSGPGTEQLRVHLWKAPWNLLQNMQRAGPSVLPVLGVAKWVSQIIVVSRQLGLPTHAE